AGRRACCASRAASPGGDTAPGLAAPDELSVKATATKPKSRRRSRIPPKVHAPARTYITLPVGFLLGRLLLPLGLRPADARRLAPALKRRLHVAQHAVPFIGPNQAPAHGVAHQLLGVLEREVTHAGRRPDRLHERVGDRAAQHARDPRERFEQRGDLRPAEFGWHRARCSGDKVAPSYSPPYIPSRIQPLGGSSRGVERDPASPAGGGRWGRWRGHG